MKRRFNMDKENLLEALYRISDDIDELKGLASDYDLDALQDLAFALVIRIGSLCRKFENEKDKAESV
jgi:hypothetical protein